MRLVDAEEIDRALIRSLAAVVPDEIEVVTAETVIAQFTEVQRLLFDHVQARAGWPRHSGSVVRRRDGEGPSRHVAASYIEPFISGDLLDIDADLTDFESGIEHLLDEAADGITEALREPWPRKWFPKPNAKVIANVLTMSFGPLGSPDLVVPSIDLGRLAYGPT